jgi:hypothetical protein
MGDSSRVRRVSSTRLPRVGLVHASPSVETTYAVHTQPVARPAGGPPTTVPPSPRTLGPRRATPPGSEYLIVPRRRS